MVRAALAYLLAAASTVAAADITGIWSGQQEGRNAQREDVAFRFEAQGDKLTGKMFGDEFDIPIAEASIAGDQVRFTTTTTNYYNGSRTTFVYTGTLKGGELELVRERVPTPEDKAANRTPSKQILKLRRLT